MASLALVTKTTPVEGAAGIFHLRAFAVIARALRPTVVKNPKCGLVLGRAPSSRMGIL